IDEAFAVEMLGQVSAACDDLASRQVPRDSERLDLTPGPARLLERGLFVAAFYDRPEYAREFLPRCFDLLTSDVAPPAACVLVPRCIATLRKFIFREQLDRFLDHVAEQLFPGQNLDALRERQGDNWLRVLAALQGMAAGWLYLGKEQQARPILTEARNWLFL